jgi:hypothetical protein
MVFAYSKKMLSNALLLPQGSPRRDSIPAGTVEKGERKQTADEVSEPD